MKIRAFITHKEAEHFRDCQDRFGININTKSVAVSDGMGSTWQQKIWAETLVDRFVTDSSWVVSHDSVKELSPIWKKGVQDFIQHLKDTHAKENLIYRNERNLHEGKSAGATFVGLRFDKSHWRCSVLGDSCLIEVSPRNVLFYTSQEGDKFDSYPDYFDSDCQKEGHGIPKFFDGELTKEITLFLVSDPFSEFLLERKKDGSIGPYLKELYCVSNHDDFEKLVSSWRDAGMHNDDSTLVIIESDGSDELNVSEETDDIQKYIEEEVAVPTSVEPVNPFRCSEIEKSEETKLVVEDNESPVLNSAAHEELCGNLLEEPSLESKNEAVSESTMPDLGEDYWRLEIDLEDARKLNESIAQDYKDLEVRYNKLLSERDELQLKIGTEDSNHSVLQNTITDLESQLARVKSERDGLLNDQVLLNKQITDLQLSLESAKSDSNLKKNQIDLQSQELSNKESQIVKLTQQVSDLENQLASSRLAYVNPNEIYSFFMNSYISHQVPVLKVEPKFDQQDVLKDIVKHFLSEFHVVKI